MSNDDAMLSFSRHRIYAVWGYIDATSSPLGWLQVAVPIARVGYRLGACLEGAKLSQQCSHLGPCGGDGRTVEHEARTGVMGGLCGA